MGHRPTFHRDVRRIALRFAHRRHADPVVEASRRLLKRPTWATADAWATDLRWLCRINLGIVPYDYDVAGSYVAVSRRVLEMLDSQRAKDVYREQYGFTAADASDFFVHVANVCGDAIRRQDWATARYAWDLIAMNKPLHAGLIAANPDYVHLPAVLRQQEALAQPSPGIH